MNFPNRKQNRLEKNFYNQGTYFITVCTYGRKKLFSSIVGAIHESPEIRLSIYGKIADQWIKNMETRFHVKMDKFVIMPDHIHFIMTISDRAIHESPLQQRSFLSKAVGYLKMNISRDIHKTGYTEKVWQRSYYDHIIRNQEDYNSVWEYMENNPAKWILTKRPQDGPFPF